VILSQLRDMLARLIYDILEIPLYMKVIKHFLYMLPGFMIILVPERPLVVKED
jgi:hypothetical protein